MRILNGWIAAKLLTVPVGSAFQESQSYLL